MTVKWKKYYSILILLFIAFVLIYNIFFYNPIYGYDAEAHYNYVDYISRYLPRNLNLPSELDSREFFNPPLPYFIPSLGQIICRNFTLSNDYLSECRDFYGKFTQVFQSLLYLFTIFFNLLTIKNINNSKSILQFEYLILIALLAVNYRTISMIRGEPYILFFLSLLLYKLNYFSRLDFKIKLKDSLQFGIIIGFLALSRQWAFFLFIPFFVLSFFQKKIDIKNYFNFIFTSFTVGFIVSSWFYFSLFSRFGTFIAFNKKSIGFSIMNQPFHFYFPSFTDIKLLFSEPIRPNFSNQFLSILYSDTWGDYWGYFVFTSRNLEIGRNQISIGSYLANVNLINLPLTFFIIFSFFYALKKYKKIYLFDYIKFSIIISIFGYLWFLISYPDLPTGDTNKASYILQVANLLVFVSSIVLKNIYEKNRKTYFMLTMYLTILLLHNFQSFISHYPYQL